MRQIKMEQGQVQKKSSRDMPDMKAENKEKSS